MISLFHFETALSASEGIPSGVSTTRLAALAIAVEAELRGKACDFFLASRMEMPEGVHASIGEAVELDAAWTALLSERGIVRAVMASAGPPRHHAVKTLLQLVEGEENPDTVQSFLEKMHEFLDAK